MRPRVRPDRQVWPPLPPEPVEGVTQPLPPVPPNAPPEEPPQALPPRPQAQPVQPVQPVQPRASEPTARPRKRGRALLVAAGALVAAAVAVGATTYDGYLFYEKVSAEETRLVPVAAGQAGTVYGIEWKAALSPTEAPPNSKHGDTVAWLKVDITEKVVDPASATMTAKPDEIRLEDRTGRTWVVEVADGDRPTERLEVGKEYRLQGLAVVPKPVAGEVELSFRPSGYRSDTPTADLFKRGTSKPDVDVLRFRR
ncbi:hypothetical protein HTZ77_43330 [Nonomuraea sp. SMC257]|uniref:DUF4352 domain-containing protein n=1 Tax=Nonomuraea montanisoli TaxID=2741721 RepID=A0A7Y6IIB2_9ACTN|nr:hypothetical protein [Nonomuraea montanisoli]NUW38185.1 hypothetical protein [Nonomuraea montanisoli]